MFYVRLRERVTRLCSSSFHRLRRRGRASSLWRFTLLHTAIVVALCALVLWAVSHFSLGYYQQRQDFFVYEQLMALQAISASTTEDEFLAAVEQLAHGRRQALVVLKTPDGYFGNLNYLPEEVPLAPDMGDFLIFGDIGLGDSRLQYVRGSQASTPHGQLLVGYNSSDFYLFAGRFRLAIYMAIGLALVVGLLSGLLFARKILGRLNAINRITRNVAGGELSARVTLSGRGDEFDELSDHINGMLNRIEDSVEAMRTVTDGIAHDLRTPLSRMKIRLDQCVATGEPDLYQLQLLQDELDRVLHTFNAMLELTRLENHQGEIVFEPCDMGSLCEEVVELAEPLAESEGRSLVLECDSEAWVKGNKQLLFRAIFNLVENAIKYSPVGSQVRLVVEQGEIRVIDQGEGIPESEQEKVFRRLYRLDSSRTTKGYGLGLTLVKAVADLHSMEVSFSNQPSGQYEGFSVHLAFT